MLRCKRMNVLKYRRTKIQKYESTKVLKYKIRNVQKKKRANMQFHNLISALFILGKSKNALFTFLLFYFFLPLIKTLHYSVPPPTHHSP